MTTPDTTSNADLKRCRKCNEWKLCLEFHKDSRSKDGLLIYCKACNKARVAKYVKEHHAQVLERQAEYQRAHPEVRARANSKYARSHKESVNKRARQYKARHRQQIAEYNAKYRSENRDEMLAQQRDYYNAHRKEIAQYRKDNPQIGTLGAQRRRTRKLGLPCNYNDTDFRRAKVVFNYRCAYCGSGPKQTDLHWLLHRDHYIPLSSPDCPGTVPENIVPACQSCNLSKNDSLPHKWIVSKFGTRKAKTIILRIETFLDSLKLTN